jgi:hypothetical protein
MNSQRRTALWICFSFAVWVFAFRGFLTSKFALISDAASYYDHTKFFIENLGHGVYPLWDPFWNNGAPNDFFLRRIGALNPFYLFILLLKSVGIPYTLSYLWFLGTYYWSGMIAFYLLARRIYQDSFIAYGGYLILLFSALGTRLFDSYMMLVTVPLIWFFYFLTAFSQTPRKHFFLGMMLFGMILAGTYIPLYFLIILGLFSVLFFLIYFDFIPEILRRYVQFFKENKILVLSSLLILIFSFFPVISFFHDSARGQVVLPIRHGDADLGGALAVPHQTLDWGAVEDLMYSSFFSDLRLYKFAVVYVPFFSVILIILGFIGRINRRAVFLFLLGVVLFCGIVPHGLPFYDFFYRHVFFLKYFRNLHFFIWFFLIPLFVMFALEQWKLFAEIRLPGPRQRYFLLIYVFFVHVIVFLFVWWRKDAVSATYVMIFLSLALCSMMALRLLRPDVWGFALLTLTVLIQPLQAYYYFSLKAIAHVHPYDYDFSYTSLKIKNTDLIKPENIPPVKQTLYYASGGYNFVYQNISDHALAKYLQNKFILVDRLEYVDRDAAAGGLERNFLTDADSAVVFKNKENDLKLNGNDPHPPSQGLRIDGNSTEFKLLSFDADHVRVRLDVPYEKFLIYNDSYDPYWRVSIDGRPAMLNEVNGAFKGVWVPAGRSVVEFSYGCWWQYAMNILLSVFALIFLAGVIRYAWLS